METLKQEAIKVISAMPDTAGISDMMYRLYVIDRVNKGEEYVRQGRTISTEQLREQYSNLAI